MVESLPCPGCHTPLPPEATGCQICMRGRTKQEIVRGYTKLREDKDRRRKRPWKILAALALLGGVGKLGLTYGDQIPELPVLNYDNSRLLPESYTGTLITSNEIKGLVLNAGRFTADGVA